MKVVISTCNGYENHLDSLLGGLDYENHLNDIIIVKGKSHKDIIDRYRGMVRICSIKNLYEYISFNMIARYSNNISIKSNKYLFIHDTCSILDCDFFWDKLYSLDGKASDPSCFYYLINKATHLGQNIGIGGIDFVNEYGARFNKYHSISKSNACVIEHENRGENSLPDKKLAIKNNKHKSLSSEGWDLKWGPGSGCWIYPILKLKKCKGSSMEKNK